MKWLVKAAFLTSAMMIVPTTLSAQNPLPDYIVGIAEKQGIQGQKISTLEETARETKREIHEFKQDVDARFDKVDKRFDRIDATILEIKQIIANSTAEANARFEKMSAETNARFEKMSAETNARFEKMSAETNARFEKYFNRMDARLNQTDAYLRSVENRVDARLNQTDTYLRSVETRVDTRLKVLEQPWSSNALVSVVTEPLTSFSMFLAVGGTLLARGEYKKLSYLTLGLSTACLAQVLWDAFALPVKYAVVSGISFMSVSGAGIYALNEYRDDVGTLATKASTGASLVAVFGFLYRIFDTWSAAEKKKTDL